MLEEEKRQELLETEVAAARLKLVIDRQRAIINDLEGAGQEAITKLARLLLREYEKSYKLCIAERNELRSKTMDAMRLRDTPFTTHPAIDAVLEAIMDVEEVGDELTENGFPEMARPFDALATELSQVLRKHLIAEASPRPVPAFDRN